MKLTEKGKKIAEIINNTIESIINYDKNYISDSELADFYVTFNKIYKNLKNVSENCEGNNG